MMKLTFVLMAFTGATMAQNCQIHQEIVEKLAADLTSSQPRPESLLVPDGHCDNGEGWACTGEIVGVVANCIAQIGAGRPGAIKQCVQMPLALAVTVKIVSAG